MPKRTSDSQMCTGDVKPQVFLDVLSGNAAGVSGTGSGRVVQSTANDHIFVYFADHGAPGLIAFPTHYLIIPQSKTGTNHRRSNLPPDLL